MPNHVLNTITFDCSEEEFKRIAGVLKGSRNGNEHIDFNVLIPMPESLDVESGSRGESAYKAYQKFIISAAGLSDEDRIIYEESCKIKFFEDNKFAEEKDWLLGKQYYENKKNYGHTTWYEWCWDHWDTKWNAYDSSIYGKTIAFNTAWSPVPTIVTKISEMFNDIRIEYCWADEDVGSNLGIQFYEGGKLMDENIPERYTTEAYEMYADITGECLEDLGLIWDEEKQEYIYKEDC